MRGSAGGGSAGRARRAGRSVGRAAGRTGRRAVRRERWRAGGRTVGGLSWCVGGSAGGSVSRSVGEYFCDDRAHASAEAAADAPRQSRSTATSRTKAEESRQLPLPDSPQRRTLSRVFAPAAGALAGQASRRSESPRANPASATDAQQLSEFGRCRAGVGKSWPGSDELATHGRMCKRRRISKATSRTIWKSPVSGCKVVWCISSGAKSQATSVPKAR